MANVAVNKVILIGRLTDDPEAPRALPNTGNLVIRIRLAVGRSRKDPNTGQWTSDPNPLYIDCEAFSRGENTRLVDVIKNYLTKGSQIYIEGRLQLDTWNDKATGQQRSKHKIVLEEVQMLDSRPTEGGEGGSRSTQPRGAATAVGRGTGASAARGGSTYGGAPEEMDEPPSRAGGDEDIPF